MEKNRLKRCLYCNKEFIPNIKLQKYCSSKCMYKFNALVRKARQKILSEKKWNQGEVWVLEDIDKGVWRKEVRG